MKKNPKTLKELVLPAVLPDQKVSATKLYTCSRAQTDLFVWVLKSFIPFSGEKEFGNGEQESVHRLMKNDSLGQ